MFEGTISWGPTFELQCSPPLEGGGVIKGEAYCTMEFACSIMKGVNRHN